MKLALLSNVNVDYIRQLLGKKYEMAAVAGYGDLWGQLLDEGSTVNSFKPQLIVIIVDLKAMLSGVSQLDDAVGLVEEWKLNFAAARSEEYTYLISDGTYCGSNAMDMDDMDDIGLDALWGQCIADLVGAYPNVHRLGIKRAAVRLGYDNFFSSKMWYMGSIPYSKEGMETIAATIDASVDMIFQTPKKVLVLDLDNTLWGGVLGECGVEGICLAESKLGAIYRDAQYIIKSMAAKGVMLAVSSKNNPSDVEKVWSHPHMVLKKEDFVALKIGWEDKAVNIKAMAEELNVGLDSFVFVDDMPQEREAVRLLLPMVTVPKWPEKKEDIPDFFSKVYEEYFKKCTTTGEDLLKTEQYRDNAKRAQYAKGLSYEDYLKGLKLKAERVDIDEQVLVRMAQLSAKTNQFNLTGRRYDLNTLIRMLKEGYIPFVYQVEDKFGSYGIVAMALVIPTQDMKGARIDTFLMSCRVMGKKVEDFVLDSIERDMEEIGFEYVLGEYIPTAKNMPVENFYSQRGYELCGQQDKLSSFRLMLKDRPKREFFVN